MNEEQFLKSLIPDIEKYFIKNNNQYVIPQGYEWFRDIITLYAKQHNLVESSILLLDNGMNEEALVLARSAINNYFLIGYLLDDDANRTRLKKYQIQPLLSQKYLLKNIKEMIEGPFGQKMQREGKQLSFTKDDVISKTAEIDNEIIRKRFSLKEKPLSIRMLAENSDERGLDLYATFYADASKFEHSDISSLNIYKRAINETLSINDAFIMDVNRTDESLKQKAYSILIISYLDSFVKIANTVINKEPQLRSNYEEIKLGEMLIKVLSYLTKKPQSFEPQ
jgi:hypothetical protein